MDLTNTRSVRDFGAKGDGAADDTAARQQAIDASAKERRTVFLPPETYRRATLVCREFASLAAHPVWA